MQTYQRAAEYLGAKSDRPLPGRSTRLQRIDPASIAVKYHDTNVVTYHADGRIVLDHGGYQTATTKARINEYAPARLSQRGGLWYLGNGIFAPGATWNGQTWTGVQAPRSTERIKRQLDRQVAKYIAGFCASVTEAKTIADPGAGDCWGCLMRADGRPEVEVMGHDHYLSHFEECYYVPSLVARAITVAGYRDPGFIWAMIGGDATRGRTDMLARTLRAFFRKIKPALLVELRGRS